MVAIFPVLMVVAIYLLLWRPQQKRIAAVRKLQAEVEVGDDVLTTSGIYGRVTRLGDADADLEIAPGTVIHVARGAIGQRLVPPALPDTDDTPDPAHDWEQGAD